MSQPQNLELPTSGQALAPDKPDKKPKEKFSFKDASAFERKLSLLTRGQLAQLRRNVGQPLPGRGVAWFYGLLDHNLEYRAFHDEVCFLVATLYDINRVQTKEKNRHFGSLGKSLFQLRQQKIKASASGDDAGAAKSLDRRFQILLDADFDEGATSELAFRLRQAIQLLKSGNIGFSPAYLICDLLYWSHPDRKVQKRWAQDYYDAPKEVREPAPYSEAETTTEDDNRTHQHQ